MGVGATLSLQSIYVSYNGKAILKDVNLQVKPGEILALVGPNGAGKTTLIRTASGILPPSQGTVQVNRHNVSQLSPSERAQFMAVVPQARHLPPSFTVYQTVMLGRTPYLGWLGFPHKEDEEIVQQVLARTQLDTLADRRLGELSGGEQQRVLLARALAQNTPILLLDEPTAHLDLHHQVHILKLVQQAVQECGLAVLLAIHDLNLVSLYADRVALLVEGRLQREGHPSQVLTKSEIEHAYGVEVELLEHPHLAAPLIIPYSNGRSERITHVP
ncbi:MAG: ABC transporter ATP-binding protein [Anaerolineales bacterium]